MKPNVVHNVDAVADYLAAQDSKGLLRFITCGSVDDGKSTLIGRLLFDSKLIFEDQLAALTRDSRKHGTVGDDIDFALLVDGLESEREQGITIDVAYRFFTTEARKFIVADTPGHEQYTRNMATGASNAELAVILVDARHGILPQTRRHSFIVSLVGIKHVVLAVNKIDLVDYSREAFDRIVSDYRDFAATLNFETLQPIPISARYGDNVMERSSATAWYTGPTLKEHLETVNVVDDHEARPFRLVVQWVNRPNLDFRGFSGTVATGTIKPGDNIVVAKSGQKSKIKAIVTYDGKLPAAFAGQAITLQLEDEIDISRGDVLAKPEERPEVADQFAAQLLWMQSGQALLPGRPYLFKCGAKIVTATVTELKYKVDINSFEHLAAKTVELNEVAVVNLALSEPIAFDSYEANHETGAFILIDRQSNHTVAAGMIQFALRRASNIHLQALDVGKNARAALNHQKPAILWFTGLSGAGKSTIANLVERKLHLAGHHTYLLDGDNVRHGLNRDLGFTDADRVENIRRVAETAKLFVDAGVIVLVSFISPFRAERRLARDLVEETEFVEIFVDTPLALAESRDPKGLYKKARSGEIKNFTGIDSPYELPETPELTLSTGDHTAEELADQVASYLRERGYIAS
ncbi:sulfate adenylyltransferase subunit CysN [Amorphus sp. 3PC139-8]|uniref:sulfate adenylyltransferase subunit CysN n=1 Tax=Amorphus sp. 3PC139-8 TaxID=2735676 RepID=UPI00345D1DC1